MQTQDSQPKCLVAVVGVGYWGKKFLATPAVAHDEMAKAARESGKDVLVEKPLAIDVRHGEELVKLAESNNRILMVGHILRYGNSVPEKTVGAAPLSVR